MSLQCPGTIVHTRVRTVLDSTLGPRSLPVSGSLHSHPPLENSYSHVRNHIVLRSRVISFPSSLLELSKDGDAETEPVEPRVLVDGVSSNGTRSRRIYSASDFLYKNVKTLASPCPTKAITRQVCHLPTGPLFSSLHSVLSSRVVLPPVVPTWVDDVPTSTGSRPSSTSPPP